MGLSVARRFGNALSGSVTYTYGHSWRRDPMAVTEAGFEELARRSAALGPRVAAVLEGGYNLETLPRLVEAALRGFDS